MQTRAKRLAKEAAGQEASPPQQLPVTTTRNTRVTKPRKIKTPPKREVVQSETHNSLDANRSSPSSLTSLNPLDSFFSPFPSPSCQNAITSTPRQATTPCKVSSPRRTPLERLSVNRIPSPSQAWVSKTPPKTSSKSPLKKGFVSSPLASAGKSPATPSKLPPEECPRSRNSRIQGLTKGILQRKSMAVIGSTEAYFKKYHEQDERTLNQRYSIINIWNSPTFDEFGTLRPSQEPSLKLVLSKAAVDDLKELLYESEAYTAIMDTTNTDEAPHVISPTSRARFQLADSPNNPVLKAVVADAKRRRDEDSHQREKLDQQSAELRTRLRQTSHQSVSPVLRDQVLRMHGRKSAAQETPAASEPAIPSDWITFTKQDYMDELTFGPINFTDKYYKHHLKLKAKEVAAEKIYEEADAQKHAKIVEEAKKLKEEAEELCAAREEAFQERLARVAAKDAELAEIEPKLNCPRPFSDPPKPAPQLTELVADLSASENEETALIVADNSADVSIPPSPVSPASAATEVPPTPPSRVWGIGSLVGSISRFVPGFRRAPMPYPEPSPIRPRNDRSRPSSRVQKPQKSKGDRRTIADFSERERKLIEDEVARQVKERLGRERAEEEERRKGAVESSITTSGGAQTERIPIQVAGRKRKFKAASPDVIPNPPGCSYGMHPDFFYDSSSDDEESINVAPETPSKRPRVQQSTPHPKKGVIARPSIVRNQLGHKNSINGRFRAGYEGSMFADNSEEYNMSVFSQSKPAATTVATEVVRHLSGKENHFGTFHVPDESSSEEESPQGPPLRKIDLAKKPLKSCLKKANDPAAPRRQANFTSPPVQLPGYVQKASRAKSDVLPHTPSKPSSLRNVTDNTSPDASPPTATSTKKAVIEEINEPSAEIAAAISKLSEDAFPDFMFESPISSPEFVVDPVVAAALEANWGPADDARAWAAWQSSYSITTN